MNGVDTVNAIVNVNAVDNVNAFINVDAVYNVKKLIVIVSGVNHVNAYCCC